jgi:hypothetical protein
MQGREKVHPSFFGTRPLDELMGIPQNLVTYTYRTSGALNGAILSVTD